MPEGSTHPSSSTARTRLDWALAAASIAMSLVSTALPLWAQPSFARMFRDFGSPEQLPGLTRFALSPWYPVALAAPGGLLVAAGLVLRRRPLLVAAVLAGGGVALLGIVLFLAAMYWPIVVVAGNVKGG